MPPFVICLVFISYTYILLYVAKQNFKISTSEYLRCASKCAISRTPPPRTPPSWGRQFGATAYRPLSHIFRKLRSFLKIGNVCLVDNAFFHRLEVIKYASIFGASPPRPPKLKSCLRHCNVACGSGITTVNSLSGSTLQCVR